MKQNDNVIFRRIITDYYNRLLVCIFYLEQNTDWKNLRILFISQKEIEKEVIFHAFN